jgi:hypothetical protein
VVLNRTWTALLGAHLAHRAGLAFVIPALRRSRASSKRARALSDGSVADGRRGAVESNSRCPFPGVGGSVAAPRENAMSDEDMKAELERLRAENERLKNRGSRAVSMKVSEKGGLSVYGLGRFPVTLYKEQWAKLLDMADDIRAFIKENESKLKTKGEE